MRGVLLGTSNTAQKESVFGVILVRVFGLNTERYAVKSFAKVTHKGLLFMLNQNGIYGNLEASTQFPTFSKQLVVLNMSFTVNSDYYF